MTVSKKDSIDSRFHALKPIFSRWRFHAIKPFFSRWWRFHVQNGFSFHETVFHDRMNTTKRLVSLTAAEIINPNIRFIFTTDLKKINPIDRLFTTDGLNQPLDGRFDSPMVASTTPKSSMGTPGWPEAHLHTTRREKKRSKQTGRKANANQRHVPFFESCIPALVMNS